ncbi:glycoside hydrolase [Saccharibacillus sp. O23]|nr:glycoside hydrolase [Saccharibacillus sp. O23]
MSLAFRGPGIVRIRYTLEADFAAKPSLIVVDRPAQEAEARWTTREDGERLSIRTDALEIRIDKKTCAFGYFDTDGRLLMREPVRGGKTLERIEVYRTVFGSDQAAQEQDYGADGLRVRAEEEEVVFDRQAYRTKLEFDWQDGEALYGLGSHEEGMMNLRGRHQYLYQQNLKASVPVLLSSRGYGILIDSCSSLSFRDDDFGSYLLTDADDEMDYYFVYGPEFDQIVAGIRELTGDAPMLPKWAYGYIQSKERYVSADELIAVAREYRDRQLPLDCVVLDWQSWTGNLWGQKTLDPERFPDPDALADELHAMNVKWMVSVWPIMSEGGDNHREMAENGFLLGNRANYNAFDPGARALYWKQAEKGLFKHGVDAWWCDCTEPFEADWKGAVKPEPERRMAINTAESRRYLDAASINAYSLEHSRGLYEGQRESGSRKRVVNLTRSAYAGQQRYATITWSGDTSATWDTLRKQIADGLNFCLTGSPYWTTDIGAFFVRDREDLWFWSGDYEDGTEDLGYRELYLRWFQLAAFLPMFRSHGTDTPRELWRFGSPGEVVYDTLEKFLKLRYRLMPCLYSLAGAVTHQRYTMFRALAFDYREDPLVHGIADQFLFGPAFLVAPVTRPMHYGPGSEVLADSDKTRNVYLPEGHWYDYWTDEKIAGGRTVSAPADLDTVPLYVRAGSIVPTGPDLQYADQDPAGTIRLKIYPGRDAAFTLYEDEGDSYDYEQGAFSTIELQWSDREERLTVGPRSGSYPGMSEQRRFVAEIVGRPGVATLDYRGERLQAEADDEGFNVRA